jgi:hypothetical protein
MLNTETGNIHNSAITKIDRYGWGLKDKPGVFAMLLKQKLIVGAEYQRNINTVRLLKIARDWSWVACGCLLVAKRPDDTSYMVIDGQHRKAAADRRADIQTLPCMIFETDDIKEEASGFLIANTLRKPLSMFDRFNALTLTEDRPAAIAAELVKEAGRTLSQFSGPSSVTCVQTLMAYAENDEKTLRSIWPIVTKLCSGHPIINYMVSGMVFLEKHLEDGVSLTDKWWTDKILAAGYARVVDCMRQSAGYRGSTTPIYCAEGIIKAINMNARKKIPHTITGVD